MPSTNPDVRSVACPSCGARYDLPAAMAGRRGRCATCGTTFSVPAGTTLPHESDLLANNPPGQEARQAKKKKPAAEPDYVGFECRVCQTRMFARVAEVGKKMKCPDCGAATEIPPPPPPKKPNLPAALEGEQYELWDVDNQPLPSELAARQPKYVAVTCRKCGTLMYASENQIGETINCPDCRTAHVVPQLAKPKLKVSVLTPEADTPQLDPAADPGMISPVIIPPRHKMVYEERLEADYARALEKSRRTGKPPEIDARGRPIIPRWPLITGVVQFLFSSGVAVRWLAFSLGFMVALSIFSSGLGMAMSGGVGAIAGMCFFAVGCILALICAGATASSLLAIIMESSDGNREIQDWPGVHDWFGDLLLVGVAGTVSAVPGWAMGKIPGLIFDDSYQPMLAVSVWVFCFPIVLLSQLDINSPWGVLSGRVLTSIAKCPFSWLLFYIEIGLLAALCGVATYFVTRSNPNNAAWLPPLYVVAAILSARLLGRLGWRLAEVLPARAPEA